MEVRLFCWVLALAMDVRLSACVTEWGVVQFCWWGVADRQECYSLSESANVFCFFFERERRVIVVNITPGVGRRD